MLVPRGGLPSRGSAQTLDCVHARTQAVGTKCGPILGVRSPDVYASTYTCGLRPWERQSGGREHRRYHDEKCGSPQ
eukprot:1183603-Prorocentrum_minimum.AAC.1